MSAFTNHLCRGCHRTFPTETSLQNHILTCIKLTNGSTFSSIWRGSDRTSPKNRSTVAIHAINSLEKILPISQPLDLSQHQTVNSTPANENENETEGKSGIISDSEKLSQNLIDPIKYICKTCGRKFSSKRGLGVHSGSCAKRCQSINILSSAEPPSTSQHQAIPPQPQTSTNLSTKRRLRHGENDDEESHCPVCKIVVGDENAIYCHRCHVWYHIECLHISYAEFTEIVQSRTPWFCGSCLLIKSNNIKWGSHTGEENIRKILENCYDTIIKWKKNVFTLPRGKCGEDFLKELTRLLDLFVHKTKWQRLAMLLIHVFIPLMLQKPNAKSKPKDNAKYLTKRLQYWSSGDLNSLMNEGKEIQKRMKMPVEKKEQSKEKLFLQNMLLGKTGAAAKFINNDDAIRGVHELTDEIKSILVDKHPGARVVHPDVKIPSSNQPNPEPVIYEEISVDLVQKIARKMQGSGGPSQIDTDMWRDFTCSKIFNKTSQTLCQSIADTAKILCTEEIDPICIVEYNACRLIPLDKGRTKDDKPGVRPIGIGEVLRRLVGKLLIHVIKDDITNAAGPLQTCSGLKSGIEAAIHSMREIFEAEKTDAILLVDAENAFNNLNRSAALDNIKELCPPFYRYLYNTYQLPAKLVITGKSGHHDIIMSNEGCTQGDVTAMALYALGIKPLIDDLRNTVNTDDCAQCWFADDSTAAGELLEIKKWWDRLGKQGPKYGYYPLPQKTVLIVKEHMKIYADQLFKGTGVKISTSGEKHLGATIGSKKFRKEYISKKVQSWIEDVQELSRIAKDEPQAAYSCYVNAISRRWSYFQRTIPDISDEFQPLEDEISSNFIPALLGRQVDPIHRDILSLPVRYGGLGILNPVETADQEFNASTFITKRLTKIIKDQESSLSNFDRKEAEDRVKAQKVEKEKIIKAKYNDILSRTNSKTKRMIELAQEKGAGAWLTALPLKKHGYVLNKQEFRDGICLRYGWRIPNTPPFCQCKKKNDIDHAVSCPNGGYTIMRHNALRDLEAELMEQVCRDVKIEPELLPLGEVNLNVVNTRNKADKGRLDVSGVGVWGSHERTFLDIRVTHPNCPTYADRTIGQIHSQHEKEKKREYNVRVLEVEKGSFTPMVFLTTGGCSPEANKHHKRIATLIADKRNEEYSEVMKYIRCRVSFNLLRSILTAIRGVRGKRTSKADPMSSVEFGLIPQGFTD